MAILDKLLIAKGDTEINLLPKMANRHGLIAGATGTGKTVSLKVLAEAFSSIGVPVFLSDIKGDLSGICMPGESKPKIEERVASLGLKDFSFKGFPTVFWDVFGQQGHPVRTTISEMGPLLLSRLMNLNETQSGVLNIVFKIADDMGMLLIDLKDLKAMLKYTGDNSKQYTTEYGTISKQTIGAIQRGLLALEEQGADMFFGEPALDIYDLIKTDRSGMGYINILASEQLYNSPALYSTFLLWLLSELFEELPEAGDLEKPKIVFFFDEAHLLFADAPKVLLQKVEQMVRLIRSKGVGVFFVTQNPDDIPDQVLGQLGSRIQHALRAFTPRDQNAVKVAAETFRPNPKLNVAEAITQLGVGEALVSFLDSEGRPSMVERALIKPPQSYLGPVPGDIRQDVISKSDLYGKYNEILDRDSAYEMLQRQLARQDELEAASKRQAEAYQKSRQQEYENEPRYYDYSRPVRSRASNTASKPRRRASDTPMERMAKSAMGSIGREVGKQLIRGILGSLLKR